MPIGGAERQMVRPFYGTGIAESLNQIPLVQAGTNLQAPAPTNLVLAAQAPTLARALNAPSPTQIVLAAFAGSLSIVLRPSSAALVLMGAVPILSGLPQLGKCAAVHVTDNERFVKISDPPSARILERSIFVAIIEVKNG